VRHYYLSYDNYAKLLGETWTSQEILEVERILLAW